MVLSAGWIEILIIFNGNVFVFSLALGILRGGHGQSGHWLAILHSFEVLKLDNLQILVLWKIRLLDNVDECVVLLQRLLQTLDLTISFALLAAHNQVLDKATPLSLGLYLHGCFVNVGYCFFVLGLQVVYCFEQVGVCSIEQDALVKLIDLTHRPHWGSVKDFFHHILSVEIAGYHHLLRQLGVLAVVSLDVVRVRAQEANFVCDPCHNGIILLNRQVFKPFLILVLNLLLLQMMIWIRL